jgi:hypothetical protein
MAQHIKMVLSLVVVKKVMKVKNSDSLKITLVTLVLCNLNGQFLEDKSINALIF